MSSTARRIIHWVVLLAMALSSAAPAFAGRASAADLAALGICTLAAQDRSADAGADLQHGAGGGHPLHHCPFCAPAAHAALPPMVAALFIAPAEVSSFVLPCPASPERPVHRGSTCRPRGPPQRA